jgi:alkylation response protein AidB-like acyl-CoA dehydrogenase
MPEPMIPTTLAAAALLLGGSEDQRRELLPAVANGEAVLSLGYVEVGSRFDPARVATRADRSGGKWRLSGEKRLVANAQSASRLVVSARTSGGDGDRAGLTLFLVDPKSSGVTLTPQHLVDGRAAAIVQLRNVEVSESAVVGEVDRGGPLLAAALDRATAALTAEMLGSMLAVFDMTLEYLKTRKQFGVLIGTFQALKHRAAAVYTETELSRSAVMAASFAIDEDSPDVAELVSLAKARLSDAFLLAANEAVQMHGGIGMTDEHDVGFFLKRARAAEMTFGDAAWHRRRYAELHGY